MFGIAVLIRPSTLPLMVVPWLVAAYWGEKRRFWPRGLARPQWWRTVGWQIAGFCLAMLPWGVRNLVVLGELALLSTHGGNPLITGIVPYASPLEALETVPYDPDSIWPSAFRYVSQGMVKEPLLFLSWFTVGKMYYLFSDQWIRTDYLSSLDFLHWLILLLGASGAVVSIWRKELRLFALMGLLMLVVQLPFVVESRFAFGIIPFFLLLAGWPLLIWQKRKPILF